MDQLHIVCPKFEQILAISFHLLANKYTGGEEAFTARRDTMKKKVG